MKELTRDETRKELISSWNEFTDGILYGEDSFSYGKCCDLIKKTKDYFDTMPISSILTTDDCRLYEAASTLRFMPDSYCPKGVNIEEFSKACQKVNEMFASLEGISK